MLTQAPRGTRDVLPADSYRWQYLEKKMREAAALAGFREVRTGYVAADMTPDDPAVGPELAREMILSGTEITKACMLCGFADYSSFFRAFKKEYGISPKEFKELSYCNPLP